MNCEGMGMGKGREVGAGDELCWSWELGGLGLYEITMSSSSGSVEFPPGSSVFIYTPSLYISQSSLFLKPLAWVDWLHGALMCF